MDALARFRHTRAARVGLAFGAVFVLGTALQLSRQIGSPAADTIWAEDGRVFLDGALASGLSAIFEPYRGYLHVVPRLVSELVAAFPIALSAALFTVISASLVSLLAVFVFVAAEGLIPSVLARIVLVMFMILVPQGWLEVTNNAANLHWYLLFGGYWAIASIGSSMPRAWPRYLVAALASLSSPFVALLLPSAALRARKGGRVQRNLLLLMVVGVVVQLTVFSFVDPDLPAESSSSILDLPRLYAVRVAASFVVGDRLLGLLWPHLGWSLAIAAVAALGLFVWLRVRVGSAGPILPSLECLVLSVGVFWVASFIRGTESMLPSGDIMSFSASRFVVVSVLFLAAALLMMTVALQHVLGIGSRLALFAILLSTAASDFRIENPRSLGPLWSAELAVAQAICADRSSSVVSVQITPRGPPGYWRVRIPCTRLSA